MRHYIECALDVVYAVAVKVAATTPQVREESEYTQWMVAPVTEAAD